jgi:hypothetical protein
MINTVGSWNGTEGIRGKYRDCQPGVDVLRGSINGRAKKHKTQKVINKNVLSYVMKNFIPNHLCSGQRSPIFIGDGFYVTQLSCKSNSI